MYSCLAFEPHLRRNFFTWRRISGTERSLEALLYVQKRVDRVEDTLRRREGCGEENRLVRRRRGPTGRTDWEALEDGLWLDITGRWVFESSHKNSLLW